jgi:hypothetical protein
MRVAELRQAETLRARVISGPHKGRYGKVVSECLCGYSLTLNVPATEAEIWHMYGPKLEYSDVKCANQADYVRELIGEKERGLGPRYWVTVWSWQVEYA